jgi:putative addiction module CopG family antidote
MEVTLKPEVEALIQEQLSSGRYQDPSDVIETALHALADGRAISADLDARIQQGLDDIDRGDVFTEDEARAYIAAMRAKL